MTMFLRPMCVQVVCAIKYYLSVLHKEQVFDVLAVVCSSAGLGWLTMSEDSDMKVEACCDSPQSHMREETQSVFIE